MSNTSYLIGSKLYRMGAEQGRQEIISLLDQPELRVTHLRRDDTQLVMIEQRMMMGDFTGQRVEIDVDAVDGIRAERIGSSGSGRYGHIDEVAIWRIANRTDEDFTITESMLTNLPDGFRLQKNFEGDFVIPLKPES